MYRGSPVIRWRRYNDRYRFVGNCDKGSGKCYYPAKLVAEKGERLEPKQFSGRGKVVSFAQVRAAPEKFTTKAPYVIAIVELAEGPRVGAMLCDVAFEDCKMGMEVEAVFRKVYASDDDGAIHYGTKFRPVF